MEIEVFDFDLNGVDEGDYSLVSSADLVGSIAAPFGVAYAHGGNIKYEERHEANGALTGTTVTQDFGILGAGSGTQITGLDTFPPIPAKFLRIPVGPTSAPIASSLLV